MNLKEKIEKLLEEFPKSCYDSSCEYHATCEPSHCFIYDDLIKKLNTIFESV